MSTQVSIPIYIINLARSNERRTFMDFQMKKQNLSYEIIEAVDGYTISEDEYLRMQTHRDSRLYRKIFNRGEVGCMLSHINAYKKIVDSQEGLGVILEDDVFLTDKIGIFLQDKVISALPKDWDIVHFSYVQRGNVESRTTKKAVMSFWERKILPHNFIVGTPVQFCYHSSGYLVSRTGAEKFLRYGIPMRMPLDILLGNASSYGIVHYITMYPLVRQSLVMAQKSTIKENAQAQEIQGKQMLYKTGIAKIFLMSTHYLKRLCGIALNKTLLLIRGHGGIITFLRKLGVIAPDHIK